MPRVGNHRVQQPQLQAQQAVDQRQNQGPGVRFKAGSQRKLTFAIKNAFNRIFRPNLSQPPHQSFHLRLPAKRGKFRTNNLQGVRNQVFGSHEARHNKDLVSFDLNLTLKRPDQNGALRNNPSFNPDYTVDIGHGRQLSGFTVSADPNAQALDLNRPVVLFLSGSGGCAEGYGGELAKDYTEQKGANFVALNYRGYGDSSDTKPSESSITKDGFAMINHLLDLGFPPDKIIVHGYSMGASVAARLQARVEADGYQLRGVIYDRPMSSATGAAKGVAEQANQSTAKYTFGTKITVGSLSSRKTLEKLAGKSPSGMRSPTILAYDNGAGFGDRSQRMGHDLNIPTIATDGGHMDHQSAINAITEATNHFPDTFFQ